MGNIVALDVREGHNVFVHMPGCVVVLIYANIVWKTYDNFMNLCHGTKPINCKVDDTQMQHLFVSRLYKRQEWQNLAFKNFQKILVKEWARNM